MTKKDDSEVSEAAVDFRRSPSGVWAVRIREAALIALVTAAVNGGVTRCASPAAANAEDAKEMRAAIARVEERVNTLTTTIAKDGQDQKNHDLLQDLAIQGLRDRVR